MEITLSLRHADTLYYNHCILHNGCKINGFI